MPGSGFTAECGLVVVRVFETSNGGGEVSSSCMALSLDDTGDIKEHGVDEDRFWRRREMILLTRTFVCPANIFSSSSPISRSFLRSKDGDDPSV